MNHFIKLSLLLCLSLTACTTQIQRPDGSIEKQALDLDMVRLMASASVASWAAATNGITEKDASAVMVILDAIDAFHGDGTPIQPSDWSPVIKRDVPPRYQALAMVLLEITAYQLKKYGLDSHVPAPDSEAWKVIEAIKAGASSALLPYINQKPA